MKQPPRFRLVWQDTDSCGAACVAILARISLEEAKECCFLRPRDSYAMDWRQLRRGLERAGLEPGRARASSNWDDITEVSILWLVVKSDYGHDHFVVYDPGDQMIYDPSQWHPYHRSESRRRLAGYMPVPGFN